MSLEKKYRISNYFVHNNCGGEFEQEADFRGYVYVCYDCKKQVPADEICEHARLAAIPGRRRGWSRD